MKRTFTTLVTTAVATAALVSPVLTTTATAAEAPARAAKTTISLKKSAGYSHVGQKGVKVTATVKKGKKAQGGKVKFLLGKKKLKSVKLKKGKASVRLPKSLKPGKYTVKAKYKKVTRKTTVRVFSSAVSVSETKFTISASTSPFDLPDLTGKVKFKNKVARKGYVDIYQNGKKKGGSTSPNYCCMASVQKNGTFEFSGYSFLGHSQEKGPGTYRYQAFFTPTASFAEYIYSSVIVVTVTP